MHLLFACRHQGLGQSEQLEVPLTLAGMPQKTSAARPQLEVLYNYLVRASYPERGVDLSRIRYGLNPVESRIGSPECYPVSGYHHILVAHSLNLDDQTRGIEGLFQGVIDTFILVAVHLYDRLGRHRTDPAYQEPDGYDTSIRATLHQVSSGGRFSVAGEEMASHLEPRPRGPSSNRTLPWAMIDNNRAVPSRLRQCLTMRLICR